MEPHPPSRKYDDDGVTTRNLKIAAEILQSKLKNTVVTGELRSTRPMVRTNDSATENRISEVT